MFVGVRIVRGPDWSTGESDGGEGHVGTVVAQDGAGRVDVIWDGGKRTTCRAGKDGKHDLRILDTGSIGIRHEGFTCEGCETTDFYGTRWTCKHCTTTSLCSTCYSADMHDISHVFLRHDMPGDSGVEVKKRTSCLMLRSLGLYPGARVVRGEDWSWGKQDGGSGSKGTITEMHDEPKAGTTGSTVRVKWDVGPSNLYRVGHEGKVDLKYVEEAPWMYYFRDNLPVLDVMGGKSTHPVVSTEFEVGCKVCLQLDGDGLRRVQADKGGWTASMFECEGKIGRVADFPSDGVATVVFDNSRYRFATEALLKVYDHSKGDVVRILDDKEKVKMLQDKHGGWNAKMEKSLGKVGRVKGVDREGDVIVVFGSRKWYFNPACCVPAVGTTVESLEDSDDDEDPFSATGLMGGFLENLKESFAMLGDTSLAGLLSAEETGGVTKAIIKGDVDTVKAMIESNPQMLSQHFGMQKLTPLIRACHVGNMEIVRFLLDSGADLEAKGHKGITALSAAIIGKREHTVTVLLEKGANIHHRHHNGQTTLHLAVHNNLPNILKVLIQKGVDVNATDKAGDTPLHDAIGIQKDECAKILIECPHVNLRLCNRNDFNALHFACLRGTVPSVEKILERDASFVNDLMSDKTFAALHIAANNDHVECCRLLIDKGKAEVDRKGPQGATPLYVAAGCSQYRSIKLLLQKGADPNFENDNGNRPLHGLCKGRGSRREVSKVVEVARLLLQEGAAYKARNKHGSAALDMCSREAEKSAIQKFIDENEGFLNSEVPPENQSRPQAPESPKSSRFITPCNKCLEKVADAKFVPCGHKVLCRSCAASYKKCPLCDTHVLHVQRSKRGDDDDDDDDDGDDGDVQCKTQ